ncbi:hypothetical protein BJ138DRAFT_864977 [Hygrophoropsis aurantiaca]|uniref:Uncharacterized protein n=1 Tax=Hygrophoropsis aurantiaca TaxID=72124 RepID=A0ACB7ZV04_9AGAM|nr:hypothetical protein BJ138DRAFT_864977 [Hygrophoropsis aurantiaca]
MVIITLPQTLIIDYRHWRTPKHILPSPPRRLMPLASVHLRLSMNVKTLIGKLCAVWRLSLKCVPLLSKGIRCWVDTRPDLEYIHPSQNFCRRLRLQPCLSSLFNFVPACQPSPIVHRTTTEQFRNYKHIVLNTHVSLSQTVRLRIMLPHNFDVLCLTPSLSHKFGPRRREEHKHGINSDALSYARPLILLGFHRNQRPGNQAEVVETSIELARRHAFLLVERTRTGSASPAIKEK